MNAQHMHSDGGESKASKRKSTRVNELWYKRYPARFRKATSHLNIDVRCFYSYLIDLYCEHGGPLPDDDKWIACALFCDVQKWKHMRKALFAARMLHLGDDGLIHQKTADEVLAERESKLTKTQVVPKTRRLGRPQGPATGPATCTATCADTFSENPNVISGGVPKQWLYTGSKSQNPSTSEDGSSGRVLRRVADATQSYLDSWDDDGRALQ